MQVFPVPHSMSALWDGFGPCHSSQAWLSSGRAPAALPGHGQLHSVCLRKARAVRGPSVTEIKSEMTYLTWLIIGLQRMCHCDIILHFHLRVNKVYCVLWLCNFQDRSALP